MTNNLQNTQPLQFDSLNSKNQLLPGTNLMSQRSHGQQIMIPGDQRQHSGNGGQKIKIPGGFNSSAQKSDGKHDNLIQSSI